MSDDVVAGEEPEYEEKLDEAPKSILLGMMRQLKSGMDLSRVTLPTFILEPRSFLEKCSDFMAHGSMILECVSSPARTFQTFSMQRIWPNFQSQRSFNAWKLRAQFERGKGSYAAHANGGQVVLERLVLQTTCEISQPF
jgi:hypothetical protein